MFRQDFTCPALLKDQCRSLPVRGCHPLWPAFPDRSASTSMTTGLLRVRSPLLAESLLMSFPPGTEMFQFPGFASRHLWIQCRIPLAGWVAPFGHPRINDRSHLPAAFRSVPRPSSPLGAKASTECPYLAREPSQHRPRAGPNRAMVIARRTARLASVLGRRRHYSCLSQLTHTFGQTIPPHRSASQGPCRQGGQSIRQIRFTVSKNMPSQGLIGPGGKLARDSREPHPTAQARYAWRRADSNR